MPAGQFDFNDPSTFNIRAGGLPDNKFVYTASINVTNTFGQTKNVYVTLRSSFLKTEEQLTAQAQILFNSSTKQRYQGTINSIAITDATRPAVAGDKI